MVGFSARTGEGLDRLLALIDSDGYRDDRVLTDVDYDIYAEGEAELGWFNSRTVFKRESSLPLDDALLSLAHDICNACVANGLEIAHGKLLLAGESHAARVSVVT